MNATTPHNRNILYMAMELSNKKWVLLFSDGTTRRRKIEMEAREIMPLKTQIEKAKKHFQFGEDVRVVSCYEAGRDGFWLDRCLKSMGIKNLVLDSASIEVKQHRRRVKTDGIDVEKLLKLLIRIESGEMKVCSIVRVPSVEEEDSRRLHRELERLTNERTGHSNRIQSLLVTQGICIDVKKTFLELIKGIKLWDGSEVPADLKQELLHEYERLKLVELQIMEIKKEQKKRLKEVDSAEKAGGSREDRLKKVEKLMRLKGVKSAAWLLVMEFFGWRKFHNGREVGSLAGLTGTPFDSGNTNREQGISKAGNKRVRYLMIELAWCWLRYQPKSKRSLWFAERYLKKDKRSKRVLIVALARQLLVDFWRYVETDKIPEGAVLKSAA